MIVAEDARYSIDCLRLSVRSLPPEEGERLLVRQPRAAVAEPTPKVLDQSFAALHDHPEMLVEERAIAARGHGRDLRACFEIRRWVRGWSDVVTRLEEVEWSGSIRFQGVAETLWRASCGPRPPASSIAELPPVTKPT